LYSGSTITTAINNLANQLIGLAISELDYTGDFDADGVNQQIIDAAAQAGYIVTGAKPFTRFEEVQFLKNSPVLDSKGNWKPLINFGVYLRASGTCKGDLPGSGSMRKRGEAFQRGLIQSTFPYANSPLITALRKAVGSGPVMVTKELEELLEYKLVYNAKYPLFEIDTQSFCRRYGLESDEYSELLNDFATMKYGQHYNGSCVSKILKLDYDLETTECDPTPYMCNTYHSATTTALP